MKGGGGGPKVLKSKSPKVQGSQGPIYIKVTFKYKLLPLVFLKLSRSKLKFCQHGIGIYIVICNIHVSCLSFIRAKVTLNENL